VRIPVLFFAGQVGAVSKVAHAF